MKKLISTAVSVVILFAIAVAANEAFLRKPARDAPSAPFVVREGTNADEVATALAEASIISSRAMFLFLASVSGSAKKIQPGTFLLQQGMSATDVLKILTRFGRREVEVTLPEGWNLRQIADRLVANGVVASTSEFFATTGLPANEETAVPTEITDDYPFLASKPASVSLEGYLFPDTYRFYVGGTAEEAARKMLRHFGEETATFLAPELRAGKTVHEIITVASILEEEVPHDADRAKVADILYRRLNRGMLLQMDSTVNYVTGKNVASVSNDDRAVDSPWNTYKYKGLPPGPISNPGISAIRAAVNPEPNPYFYFLTTPEGDVIYSRTNDEHNAAKAKYLR